MKRIALLIALAAAVVVLVASGEGEQPYRVRAIFDNAGFVIPGEDVKVAGVKVGAIESLDVTDQFQAAVVLEISEPGYQDFRRDASCIVRPQSLIGERFVECKPTQARAAGSDPPPELREIEDGPGKGQRLLPVENTMQTVDVDVIGNTLRAPERERLSLILNELGTGVAGRGRDLDEVIRRANPALRETDRALEILAEQNTVLADLAVNSDTVLAPLARDRKSVAGAIRNTSEVAKATAERRDDLEADIQTLPAFLDELKPTMVRLGSLADESTPVLSDLGDRAPAINALIRRLGPFSQAAIGAVDSLGEAAKTGTPAVTDARPAIADLRNLARAVRPVGSTLRQVLESFRDTNGIERALDYIFYQVAAINGFDSLGHYLRAGLIVNQCASYSVEPVAGCSANFPQGASSSAALATAGAVAAAGDDPVLRRTAIALARALDQAVDIAKLPTKREEPREKGGKGKAKSKAKTKARAPEQPVAAAAPAAAAPRAAATPEAAAAPSPGSGPSDALLDYLFGRDGPS
jgi:phospholipid/cholesterol/gamma-HCH transport system substrate-binding protein